MPAIFAAQALSAGGNSTAKGRQVLFNSVRIVDSVGVRSTRLCPLRMNDPPHEAKHPFAQIGYYGRNGRERFLIILGIGGGDYRRGGQTRPGQILEIP